MRSVPSDLAAAILAPERVTFRRLWVDWDGDGYDAPGLDDLSDYAGTVRVARTLETQLPQQVRATAGVAAATLDADLVRGNVFGQAVPVSYRSASSATTGSALGPSLAVPVPAGTRVGDLVVLWIGAADHAENLGLPALANVAWAELSWRGDNADFSVGNDECNAHLLCRRATAADLALTGGYTFTFDRAISASAVAACLGDQYILGVHGYVSTGLASRTAAVSAFTTKPLTTTLDGCLLLSFFAARTGAAGTNLWRDGPAGDVQVANVSGTNATSNVALLVTRTPAGVAKGTYQTTATLQQPVLTGVTVLLAVAPAPGGDEAKHAALTFSELNGSSPYAGKPQLGRPLRTEVGFATASGVQYVPELVGQTTDVAASSRQRRASLHAVDNRMAFRGRAADLFTLPVMAEWPSPSISDTPGRPRRPGLNACWLASYAFANCATLAETNLGTSVAYAPPWYGRGFYTSPNSRPSTMVHIPCHGSTEPWIGNGTRYAYTQNPNGSQRRIAFGKGPFVAATEAAPAGGLVAFGADAFAGGADLWTSDGRGSGRIEYYVRLNSAGGTVDAGGYDAISPTSSATRYTTLRVTSTGALQWEARVTATGPGTTTQTVTGPVVPADGRWHMVAAHWDLAAGTVVFRLDGQSVASSYTAFPSGTMASTFVDGIAVTLTGGAQLAELQLCGGVSNAFETRVITAATAWIGDGFTPTAFVDLSDNDLDGLVPPDGSLDLWGLLQQVAEAAYEAVYVDADGYPHYRGRRSDYSTAGQTLARTLTSLAALTELDYSHGLSVVRNAVTVPYSPLTVVQGGKAWTADAPVRVPPGGTYTWNITLPGYGFSPPFSSVTVTTCNTKADGTGTNLGNTNLAWSSSVVGTAASVSVTNNNNVEVWLVDTSGSPSVSLTASWITTSSVTQTPAFATDSDPNRRKRYGIQPMVVATNVWRQRADIADLIARWLRDELSEPRPVLTRVGIVGDPRLELGDVVRIQDPDGLGLDDRYRLVGVSPTHEPGGGYTQEVTARQAPGLFTFGVSRWGDGSRFGSG